MWENIRPSAGKRCVSSHIYSDIITLVISHCLRAIKTKILWSKLMCTVFVFTFEIISLFVVGLCFLSLILCLAQFTFHSSSSSSTTIRYVAVAVAVVIRRIGLSTHNGKWMLFVCIWEFFSFEELAFCLSFNHCFQWNCVCVCECVCVRNGRRVACIETFCAEVFHFYQFFGGFLPPLQPLLWHVILRHSDLAAVCNS